MSTSPVLRLDEYRVRRRQRWQRTEALYAADADRARAVEQLGRALSLVGGDRAATVWVDEYGPGLVHVHTVVDLASDRPRRSFYVEPLRAAWQEGVPGILDVPDLTEAPSLVLHDPPRSTVCVALGSDGLRGWFLVVDSLAPRGPLSEEAKGDLMFVAGECASILLHRDLDATDSDERVERFSAWPVLRDIEGSEADEGLNRRISCRFLVARTVRSLVEDDLAADEASLAQQVRAVRTELGDAFLDDPERRAWDAVLAALEAEDRHALPAVVLELALRVEEQGHFSGAGELYRSAYEVAMAVGAAREAVDAARFHGRVCRQEARWREAVRWYDVARGVARAVGDLGSEAKALSGLVNIHRDRGNYPEARRFLDEGLEVAERSGDREAKGLIHHNLMVVSHAQGDFEDAIRHGWAAVRTYDREQERLHALTSLAGVFVDGGELGAAEHAYGILVRRLERRDFRLVALHGHAQVAALRGERAAFESRLACLDQERWDAEAPLLAVQITYERGLAYEALGERTRASEWLARAVELAEAHSASEFVFRAEEAQERVARESAGVPDAPRAPREVPEDILRVREELGEMHRELVPAG